MLATISPKELLVNKCLLPNEITVIRIYVAAVAVLVLSVAYQVFVYCSTARVRKTYPTYHFVPVKTD